MTTPIIPLSLQGLSPAQIFQQQTSAQQQQIETEQMIRMRQAYLDDMQKSLAQMNSAAAMGKQTVNLGQQPDQLDMFSGVQGGSSSTAPAGAPQQQGQQMQSQGLSQVGQETLRLQEHLQGMSNDELVSRAQMLGIAGAEAMPAEVLRQVIASQEHALRPTKDVGAGLGIPAAIVEMGLGAASTLAKVGRQFASAVPFVGDVIDRSIGKHTTENWLAGLDENVRRQLGPQDQIAASLASGAGSFLPYAGLGEAAFKGIGMLVDATAGLAPAIGRIAGSAMARGAVQGAGTALLLDAGSDREWLPSANDVSKLLSGDSDMSDRLGAAYKLTFGTRLMNAALGGAIGGVLSKVSNDLNLKQGARRADEYGAFQQAMDIESGQTPGLPPGVPPDPRMAPQAGPLPSSGFVYTIGSDGIARAEVPGPVGPAIPTGGQPGLRDMPQGTPQVNVGAARATPDYSVETANVPTPPNAGLLPGPVAPEAQGALDQYGAMLDHIDAQRQQVQARLDAGDMSAGVEMENLGAARNQISREYYQRKASLDTYQRSTVGDVAPDIVRLRGQILDMQNSGLATDADVENATNQLTDLMYAARIPRMREPTAWDVLRTDPLSPKTPSAQVVAMHGTTVTTPSGEPKMMFHGTGTGYDIPDPQKLMADPEGQLVGPGWYWTENPIVAAGDPSGRVDTPGYANGRAGSIEGLRGDLTIQVSDLQRNISQFEKVGPASGITPEAYGAMKQQLPQLQNQLGSLPVPAPNVRTAFLAVKNLFEYDEAMDPSDVYQYIQHAADKHPEHNFDRLGRLLSQVEASGNNIMGKDLYQGLATTTNEAGVPFGKALTNEILKDMGHDGIAYDGGMRIGAGSGMGTHQAINVFDPKHVVSTFLDEPHAAEAAQALGVQMAKLHAVADSPAINELAGHAVTTDADVVQAMVSAKPGSFHVLKGVDDMQGLVQSLTEKQFGGDLNAPMHHSFLPVVHPSGRMDMLVSSFGELTPEMAADYSKTGLFPGMEVVKSNGASAKVVRVLDENTAWVQTPAQAKRGGNYGNPHKIATLAPSNSSGQTLEAPQLYNDFKDYALAHTTERMQSLGQADYVANWLDDPQVFQRLTPLFDQFANDRGIADPNVRAGLFRYFDQQRIGEFADAAPQEVDLANDIADEVSALDMNHEPDLHELGATKGYEVVPNEGKPGFVVQDTMSDQKFLMNDEEAVKKFLHEMPVDRLPDLTPSSPVPAEVVPQYTDSAMHLVPTEEVLTREMVNDAMPDWEYVTDDQMPSAQAAAAAGAGGGSPPPAGGTTTSSGPGVGGRRNAATAGRRSGGGGGGNPPGGNTPAAGGAGGGGRQPSARAQALRTQLQSQDIVDLMHRHERSVLSNVISPMRTFFADLENDLHNAGATDVKPWELFDQIIAGQDRGHNETFPVHQRIGDQLARVKRAKMRDGSWWKLFETKDPVQRAATGVAQGFKNDEIAAVSHVRKALVDMLNAGNNNGQAMVDELIDFIDHARTEHSKGNYGPSSYNAAAYPNIGFYADHAADTMARFEKVDPRTVLRQFVRSYGFAKYAGAAWNEAHDTFSAIGNLKVEGKQIYRPLANFMLDWMDYAQRGAQPGKDLAVRVTNSVLRKMGVPLTHVETKALMQGMMTKMYEATQGWRVHVVVRDSLQPLLAAPTVDMENLGLAYKNAVKFGSADRQAMLQRAYDTGVTQHAMPRVEGTGMFENNGVETGSNFNQFQTMLREAGLKVGDAVRDASPRFLRNVDRALLGPLGVYTREGEWNRIIVGEAAHLKFENGLADWNAGRSVAMRFNGINVPNAGDLARSINMDSFPPAMVRRFTELVNAGNMDDAKSLYMRAVADRTQFTYGGRHAPRAVRTTAGRMGFAFGNFSVQSIQLAKQFLKYGSVQHKVKALATVSAVTGALELAHRKTGWNFRNYEWWGSLMFTGSPLLRDAANAYQTANAMRDVVASDNPPQDEVRTLQRIRGVDVARGLIQTFNPAQGAVYTGGGIAKALDSSTPGTNLAHLFLTGDTKGGASEYNQAFSQPMPEGQAAPQVIPQASRVQAPPVRLPGVNQFNATHQAFQGLVQQQMEAQRKAAHAGSAPDSQSQVPPVTPRPGGGFF